jgi:ADP-heptose:LPS heptosyltransferase
LINTKNLNTGYIKTENIIETAEVIRKSDLVISPDTSVIHICSAFNIPVIGIYPDVKWNLEKFYPMSVFREVIVSGNKNDIGDVKSDQIINSFDQIIRKILW